MVCQCEGSGSMSSEAPRQGNIVQTKHGRERHLDVKGTTFRIPERYNNLNVIGKGSYGVVCSATDSLRNTQVAIKKITPMAAHSIDAKHVLREVRVMRYLGTHENIVTLEDLFCNKVKDELYIVMELLESDLHRIIQSKQALSMQHHKVFMLQILRGVGFLHRNGIIHRDLKPGNILVTHKCELRISDFGLARERPKDIDSSPETGHEEGMTEHVVTRWYRPPELMLSPNGFYDFSVDVWSVGCIFGELLGRRPLFPGSSFVDQLCLIFDVIGEPTPEEVAHIRGVQARKFLDTLKGKTRVSFSNLLPGIPTTAASLLKNLLLFDPLKRYKADEALYHPFFKGFRRNSALNFDRPTGLQFEFEKKGVPRSKLRGLIAVEIDHFQSGANLEVNARHGGNYSGADSGRRSVSANSSLAVTSEDSSTPDSLHNRDGSFGSGGNRDRTLKERRERRNRSQKQHLLKHHGHHHHHETTKKNIYALKKESSRSESVSREGNKEKQEDKDDLGGLDAASLQSSRLCSKIGDFEGKEDEEDGKGGYGVNPAVVVIVAGKNGRSQTSTPSSKEDLELHDDGKGGRTDSHIVSDTDEGEWLTTESDVEYESNREGEKMKDAREKMGVEMIVTGRGDVGCSFRATYSPVGVGSSGGKHGRSSIYAVPRSSKNSLSIREEGRPSRKDNHSGWAPIVLKAEKSECAGRPMVKLGRDGKRSCVGSNSVVIMSPSDPSSSVRSFVSPVSVRVDSTRQTSVAGFVCGSDGWEEDSKVWRAGKSGLHEGRTIAVRKFSSDGSSAGPKEKKVEMNVTNTAKALVLSGGGGGARCDMYKEQQPSMVTQSSAYASGSLRRERAERAWHVVGEARAKVKAQEDAEAAATVKATSILKTSRGMGQAESLRTIQPTAVKKAAPRPEHTVKPWVGLRRNGGGRVISRVRPPLSPPEAWAKPRTPVAGKVKANYSGGRGMATSVLGIEADIPFPEVVNNTFAPPLDTVSDRRRLPTMDIGQKVWPNGGEHTALSVCRPPPLVPFLSRNTVGFLKRSEVADTGRQNFVVNSNSHSLQALTAASAYHPLRAPIASVRRTNSKEVLAPEVCRVNHPVANAVSGAGSVASSRGSPPPVPPRLGRPWRGDRKVHRHGIRKGRPSHSRKGGGVAIVREGDGVGTIGEKPLASQDMITPTGRVTPPRSSQLPLVTVAPAPPMWLPPRAGHVASIDTRGQDCNEAPLLSTVTEKKVADRSQFFSAAIGEPCSSSSAYPPAPALSGHVDAKTTSVVSPLKLPSRPLPLPRGITISAQTRDADGGMPTMLQRICHGEPLIKKDKLTLIAPMRVWSRTQDQAPPVVPGVVKVEQGTSVTRVISQRPISLPARQITEEDGPALKTEEGLITIPEASEDTMSLASAIFTVDESINNSAGTEPLLPHQPFLKPLGYPLGPVPTDHGESGEEGPLSVASVEQNFSLLTRLWSRPSMGRGTDEQGAISPRSRTTGSISFTGHEQRATAKDTGMRKIAKNRLPRINQAAHPTSVGQKAIIASRSKKRSSSSVTSSTSLTSSATSGSRKGSVATSYAAGSGMSPVCLQRGSNSGPKLVILSSSKPAIPLTPAAATALVGLPRPRSPFQQKRESMHGAHLPRVLPALRVDFLSKQRNYVPAETTAVPYNDDRRSMATKPMRRRVKTETPIAADPETEIAPSFGGGGGCVFRTNESKPPRRCERPCSSGASEVRLSSHVNSSDSTKKVLAPEESGHGRSALFPPHGTVFDVS